MDISIDTADFFRSTENQELSDFFINTFIAHHKKCRLNWSDALEGFLKEISTEKLKINASKQAIENLIIFSVGRAYEASFFDKGFEKLVRGRRWNWSLKAQSALDKLIAMAANYDKTKRDCLKRDIDNKTKKIADMQIEIEKKIKELQEEITKAENYTSTSLTTWKAILNC